MKAGSLLISLASSAWGMSSLSWCGREVNLSAGWQIYNPLCNISGSWVDGTLDPTAKHTVLLFIHTTSIWSTLVLALIFDQTFPLFLDL